MSDQVLPDSVHTNTEQAFRDEELRLREAYNAAALAWMNHVHKLPDGFVWRTHPYIIGQVAWMCSRCERIEPNFDRTPRCGCSP